MLSAEEHLGLVLFLFFNQPEMLVKVVLVSGCTLIRPGCGATPLYLKGKWLPELRQPWDRLPERRGFPGRRLWFRARQDTAAWFVGDGVRILSDNGGYGTDIVDGVPVVGEFENGARFGK